MNAKDRQDEMELLQRCGDAHGELAAMVRRMNDCASLLEQGEQAESEQVARSAWHTCQQMRQTFLRDTYGEHVADVLSSIDTVEDHALVWLAIVRTAPPGWVARRRAERANIPYQG